MSRVIYKGPFISKELPKKIKNISKIKPIKIYNRALTICPILLGKTVEVYNGKKFISLFIEEKKLGQKIGKFIFTKKSRSAKKTDSKIKTK